MRMPTTDAGQAAWSSHLRDFSPLSCSARLEHELGLETGTRTGTCWTWTLEATPVIGMIRTVDIHAAPGQSYFSATGSKSWMNNNNGLYLALLFEETGCF